ncbi:MAG: PHP domain-containing protein [Saprospiraceae bacterium]|nr:PHP domain-containing protein [Saprospiraceae bacterium]
MTNKEIAYAFDDLANLMELHGDDEFRIRSYRNAYLALRKLDTPLAEMPEEDIKNIKGVGNAIAAKIRELVDSGHMANLDKYREKTPAGVQEMLEINGFGPKKVRQVWQEMAIETVGELWYACNENRLVEYKGFGLKTQEDLLKKLDFFQKSRGKLHMDAADELAEFVCTRVTQQLPGAYVTPVGEVRRRCPIVNLVEVLVGYNGEITAIFDAEKMVLVHEEGKRFEVKLESGSTVVIHQCLTEEFGSKLFRLTGTSAYVKAYAETHAGIEFRGLRSEEDVFEKVNTAFVAPELREDSTPVLLKTGTQLIEQQDLVGVLHVHTTYSDGLHSLRQMCERARELGYDYIGITDHSQAAFYANGLKPDRLLQQWDEIDALNAEMAPFRILKGIESDILNDGSLDYEDAVLDKFDFIIASVHSNLRMSIEKATARVLRAIEHPRTTILGHPTGRLLLSREGYPLDWDAVFEACKKHEVAIELNAHPYRLDIDYTLIPKALSYGIPISINPDAHSISGLEVVRYGLSIARKGGLTKEMCFNAKMPDHWKKPPKTFA